MRSSGRFEVVDGDESTDEIAIKAIFTGEGLMVANEDFFGLVDGREGRAVGRDEGVGGVMPERFEGLGMGRVWVGEEEG